MGPDEWASVVPVGTVTFLVVDLGPTVRAGEIAPARPLGALDRHRELVFATAVAHGGKPADDEDQAGSSFATAAFPSAADAVAAALEMQRTVGAEPGSASQTEVEAAGSRLDQETSRPPLHPRIGLHTGEALLRDDRRYTGATIQHGARLRDLAHGGQTLMSSATASAVAEGLPAGAWLEDLGSHRLWDLSRPERVFQLRHAALAQDFPPPRSLDTVANNLPTQLTSFVGRDGELTAVGRLLAREQLVTLTGAGGCGKTRLALQTAAQLAGRWPDGVWWVDLAPVAEPDRVAESVASVTGVLVEPVGGALAALAPQLRDRRLLICLDNCEHLLDASAELAEALLRSCPEVSILTTSREPLGVVGETVWRVPSLATEESVALFIERASRVRPWFTLDETNEAAVRTLCRQLDGIPLAVELAAAWLRTLTPAQIAAGLDDRFRLLVGGPRGASARQQTLAASMAWSHDLLDETDRAVLRRLAVFAGGFTLHAARSVCAGDPIAEPDVLPALGRLVDKSLVVMDERDGDARYRLLETTRQYAAERLAEAGETTATRGRHLDHYLDLAETAEHDMEGEDHDASLTRLGTEHDNFRAALQWGLRPAADDGPTDPADAAGMGDAAAREGAAAGLPERSRCLAAALVGLWHFHGHVAEGAEMLQRAIDLAPEDRSALQARLLYGLARVARVAVRLDVTLDAAQQGVEIASENGDDRIRGRCLLLSALAQLYLDAETARELCRQARGCAEAVGDASTADAALVVEGSILSSRDRHEAARPLLQEGLERCLARGDREFATMALVRQGHAAVFGGEMQLGKRLALQAVEAAEPLEDYYSVGTAVGQLAWVEGISGDIEAGHRLMEPTVRSIEGVDQDVYVPWLATVSGMLCLWDGDLEGARRWFERDLDGFDPSAGTVVAARVLPGLTTALRRLGRLDEARAKAERAVALTRDLGMPHMEAEALEQMALLTSAAGVDASGGVGAGRADDGGGEAGEAANLHHQALALRFDHGLRIFCVDSLENLADLAARAESFTEAVRLLAASDTARDEMGYPRPPVRRPEYETTLAELRRALDEDAFAEAWAEGTALSLDDAVAYVRRARGTRDRPATGWDSLTPTERDVVRLVTEGLTNPEIGTRLLMSRATVKTHLSHVYAKLGVANRVELASRARSSGAIGG